MTRMFATGGLLLVGLAFGGSDLYACGDKSLAPGGIRSQRALAARYPASILIYKPVASRMSGATRELQLERNLNLVGHKYREVPTVSELQASVDSGHYNIVMADYADAVELERKLASARARVVVIPVAYQMTKAEMSQAAKQSRFLIKAPGRAVQYLEIIAKAVQFGSGATRKS